MFNLSENFTVDRPILECDYVPYTPPSLYLVTGENNQSFFVVPREEMPFP